MTPNEMFVDARIELEQARDRMVHLGACAPAAARAVSEAVRHIDDALRIVNQDVRTALHPSFLDRARGYLGF